MEKIFNSKQLLDEVDKLSNQMLKRRDDLLAIFQCVETQSLESNLEETAFIAKYIMGLLRVLKATNENSEITDLDNVKKDLSASFEKVKGEIKQIIIKDKLLNVRFEAEYFAMNQTAFAALNELLHDLEWTKKYFNILKRSKKN